MCATSYGRARTRGKLANLFVDSRADGESTLIITARLLASIGDREMLALPPQQNREGVLMSRSPSRPHTLGERLADFRVQIERKAGVLKPGIERNDLLRKIQQVDDTATSSIDG